MFPQQSGCIHIPNPSACCCNRSRNKIPPNTSPANMVPYRPKKIPCVDVSQYES